MRTTLTLDDDVAAMLEKAMKKRGAGLKEVVNEALRGGGLPSLLEPKKAPAKPFVQKTFKMEPRVRDFDRMDELLDDVEGPWRR